MRIISGSARGRKLFTPPEKCNSIRPSSDRAREALFSILGSRIQESTVLDLFAGTGAFGCEALSRGAKRVTFIDNSRQALALIRKNISLIPGSISKCKIVQHDLRRSLPFSDQTTDNDNRFDIIFADPPYRKGLGEKILHLLDNSSILSKKVLVIVEEQNSVNLDCMLTNLILRNRRCYGNTCFHFYSRPYSSNKKKQKRDT